MIASHAQTNLLALHAQLGIIAPSTLRPEDAILFQGFTKVETLKRIHVSTIVSHAQIDYPAQLVRLLILDSIIQRQKDVSQWLTIMKVTSVWQLSAREAATLALITQYVHLAQ